MPKIITDPKQKAALDDIIKHLEAITVIDNLCFRENDSPYMISAKINRKSTEEVSIAGKFSAKVSAILTMQRGYLCKEVRALASKYMIMLSEEDESLLSAPAPSAQQPGE